MAIDGFKVLQLVKDIDSNSSLMLRTLTKLIVGSSCVLIATVIALLISAIIIGSGDDSTDTCMAFMMVYRILELSIMALIAIPLRKYENKSPPASSSAKTTTPARQSICEISVDQ
eukprot:CAMPEP_0168570206 /NCGR_PEP_ID=MMETSP0413-20121227/16592_1 /TAXON_ID=136452 /ORGANISM="Filamoeba nolandi, Strain NC-AS-23-1" /LENGTH=114 /DNA_ID=CAMNT_0008602803 /DNA_START=601 /DNA_END=945 /DNA_ORIENTATION=+